MNLKKKKKPVPDGNTVSVSGSANLDFLSAAVWCAAKLKWQQTDDAMKGAGAADAGEAVKKITRTVEEIERRTTV